MMRPHEIIVGIMLLAVGLTALASGALPPLLYASEQPGATPSKPKEEKPARIDRYGDPLPEGALARLGTLRLRTLGALLAFHPNGKTIVSVVGGRQVTLWDADTGELCERCHLPIQPPFVLFLSSDGRLLGVKGPDGDAPIDIWDVEKGKKLQKFQPPQRWGIYRTAFSSANKMLAVSEQGGNPRIIRLWDLASGGQRVLKGDRSSFDHLAFSPDGKLLAASDGRRVTCWDTSKGEQLWQTGGTYGIALAFTSDGKTLIGSAGNRERAWHAWDAATGKPTEGLKLPEGYNYAEMAAAPDGRTLVFVQRPGIGGSDGRVRIWDLQ